MHTGEESKDDGFGGSPQLPDFRDEGAVKNLPESMMQRMMQRVMQILMTKTKTMMTTCPPMGRSVLTGFFA